MSVRSNLPPSAWDRWLQHEAFPCTTLVRNFATLPQDTLIGRTSCRAGSHLAVFVARGVPQHSVQVGELGRGDQRRADFCISWAGGSSRTNRRSRSAPATCALMLQLRCYKSLLGMSSLLQDKNERRLPITQMIPTAKRVQPHQAWQKREEAVRTSPV